MIELLTYNIKGRLSKRGQKHLFEEITKDIHHFDFLCFQEVFLEDGHQDLNYSPLDQYFPHCAFGANADFPDGKLGNIIFSKHKILDFKNYDLSFENRESRGAIIASINYRGQKIELVNVHLGLKSKERAFQLKKLMNTLDSSCPKVLCGDFNDWRGTISCDLFFNQNHFKECVGRFRLKTFPSFFPIFALDRVYLSGFQSFSSEIFYKSWKKLSDHLPLGVKFDLGNKR